MKHLNIPIGSESGKIYFASDFHLGIPDYDSSRRREKLLVQWLDFIRKDAALIVLMGDIFDFWFEYKTVVPKGYIRLFGKLAEISDAGIPIHLFKGNHDIWAFDYLNKELNIQLHRKPMLAKFHGKTFFLAHGDGLGKGDRAYKLLKHVFEFTPNQWLFKWLHPDLGAKLGLYFSKKSRSANLIREGKQPDNFPVQNSRLYHFSTQTLQKYPDIDYFVFGHMHQTAREALNDHSELIILGDWIMHFSYAVFDGEKMNIKFFSEKKQ